jgi:hypothetical protein
VKRGEVAERLAQMHRTVGAETAVTT